MSKNSFVCASPFELPDNLIVLSESLTPVVTTALLEDHGGAFLNVTLAIVEAVSLIYFLFVSGALYHIPRLEELQINKPIHFLSPISRKN